MVTVSMKRDIRLDYKNHNSELYLKRFSIEELKSLLKSMSVLKYIQLLNYFSTVKTAVDGALLDPFKKKKEKTFGEFNIKIEFSENKKRTNK